MGKKTRMEKFSVLSVVDGTQNHSRHGQEIVEHEVQLKLLKPLTRDCVEQSVVTRNTLRKLYDFTTI